MKLFVGLGRIEMSTWMYWWQEELEGLNAEARELEATIAANVARAYGRGVDARKVIRLRLVGCR